jgi:hypothetical protein
MKIKATVEFHFIHLLGWPLSTENTNKKDKYWLEQGEI